MIQIPLVFAASSTTSAWVDLRDVLGTGRRQLLNEGYTSEECAREALATM